MAKKQADYFGLSYIISLILAIIPITSLVCGIITRFMDKKYVAAIIRILFGWNIIWICDLVMMIVNKSILRVLNV